MVVEEKNLNDNDKKLLSLCRSKPYTINVLSKILNISPASVSVKVKDLEKLGLLEVSKQETKGRKTFVRTKGADRTEDLIYKYLKELKKYQPLEQKKFLTLMSGGEDSETAWLSVLYRYPPLVENKLTLTPEGEKFIEEFEKSHNQNIK